MITEMGLNFKSAQSQTEIIPRATIEQIVKHRNRALELYEVAFGKMLAAARAEMEADLEGQRAHGKENSFNAGERSKEKEPRIISLSLPTHDEYMATRRHSLDVEVWANIVELTQLKTLMDKTAKDELRKALSETPPEVTIDNIRATLEGWILGADTTFRRGIAVCFSNLDRRFKSHDGWKIGSRVILTYAFDGNGYWNYRRNHQDTITDIERVFLMLDGKKVLQYGHLVDQMRNARGTGSGARRTEFENDYFLLRAYKNGNCHVWFKRDDLMDRVNQLLGEYYGAPLPEERDAEEHTGLNDPKTSLAKNYGFFPTPDKVAHTVIDECRLDTRDDDVLTVEPSAGTGALARLAAAKGALVDCIEVQASLARALTAENRYREVYVGDFLWLNPQHASSYDRVVMNPPFDRERDIDHVMHALKFLKPTGFLVAVMSAGTEFRSTKKSVAFRELMKKMNARWRDLPEGSFRSVGTTVNTVVLRVYKDGRSFC